MRIVLNIIVKQLRNTNHLKYFILYFVGVSYRGSHYIQPELSQSKLSFNDLFLEPDTGMVRPCDNLQTLLRMRYRHISSRVNLYHPVSQVRAREVYMCVCFTLWSCRMIPTPGVGLQVLSRHIRLCASDGARVLLQHFSHDLKFY